MAPSAYDGRRGGYASAQPRPTPYDAPAFFTTGDPRAADWSEDYRPKRNNVRRGLSTRLLWSPAKDTEVTSISAIDFFDRKEVVEVAGVAFADTRWRIRNSIRVISEEVRIRHQVSSMTIEGGVYAARDDYAESSLLDLRDSPFNPVLGVNELLVRSRQSTDQAAAFGGVTARLVPALSASVSGRYSRITKDWRSCSYDSGDGSVARAWNHVLTPFVIRPSGLPDPGIAQPGGCALYNDLAGSAGFGDFAPFQSGRTDEGGSWRLGLDWGVTPDVVIQGSIAQGFKSGGFNGVVTQTYSQAKPYGSERLRAYEVGIRAGAEDAAARLKVALFYNDYSNKQETTFAITPVGNIPALTNIPKAEVYGVDLQAEWAPVRTVRLGLNGTYSESKIKDYWAVDPASSRFPDVVLLNAAGFPLPNAPHWQVRGTAAYIAQLSTRAKMQVSGGLSYKSKSYGTADKMNPLGDYWLVDGSVTFSAKDDSVFASLWGQNITNAYYWTAAYAANGVYARLNGEPATFGVTFGVRH